MEMLISFMRNYLDTSRLRSDAVARMVRCPPVDGRCQRIANLGLSNVSVERTELSVIIITGRNDFGQKIR
jgi:hypothetical protein